MGVFMILMVTGYVIGVGYCVHVMSEEMSLTIPEIEYLGQFDFQKKLKNKTT